MHHFFCLKTPFLQISISWRLKHAGIHVDINVRGKASFLWTCVLTRKMWPVHQFFLREGSFCFSTKKSFWLHCHRAGSASSWCNKWSCFISLISQLSSCLHISSSRPVSCSVVMCYRSFAHWACSLPLCQPWIYTLAMVGFKQ